MIVLALVRIDRAAGVEPKNFIAEVQSRSNKRQTLVETVAALHVKLRMSVEVLVAQGSLQPEDWVLVSLRIGMLISVREEIGVIVAHAKAHRKPGFVIGKSEIPGIGGLTLQGRVVYSPFSSFVSG